MPPSSPSLILIVTFIVSFSLLAFANPNPNPSFSILSYHDYGFNSDSDYSPPPLPSPPLPSPSATSCLDLAGDGDFNTLCKLNSTVNLTGDVVISGNGSLSVLPGVTLACVVPGCSIVANLSGSLWLGKNAAIVAGAVEFAVANMSVLEGAVVNTTGLGGDPPERTTGAGTGIHGDGGGHGGRGASCYVKDGDSEEDSWGGDVYDWDYLTKPESYGSKGGTTSLEVDYGGGGGGRVKLKVNGVLEVDGVISADGGDGGELGGGGSGGSIYIMAKKM